MYVANFSDLNTTADYDNFTNLITTNNIRKMCTHNEKNIDITIPTFLSTIPCGLSFLCLQSSMAYRLIKPLITIN